MSKFDTKSIFLGLVIGILVVSTISIASNDPVIQTVESAFYNNSKVFFNQQEIPTTHQLIEVYNNEEGNPQLYMPLDDILEYMNFDVQWNQENDTVILTMNNSINQNTIAIDKMSNITLTELESNAIELIRKTGNWKYIEPYLHDLSNEAIEEIISIYNSKHQDPSEHKHAVDYVHD